MKVVFTILSAMAVVFFSAYIVMQQPDIKFFVLLLAIPMAIFFTMMTSRTMTLKVIA